MTFTVTLHLAVLPLTEVAVMVALPFDRPVTTPFSSTLATEGFEEVQVTVWS